MLMQITVFVQAADRSACPLSVVTDSIRSCVQQIAGVTAVEIESRHPAGPNSKIPTDRVAAASPLPGVMSQPSAPRVG